MKRDDAIKQAMDKLASSQQAAIGEVFDAGAESIDQSGLGKQFAQVDIDAAVLKVTAEDQSHMKELQKEIELDQSQMSSLKLSMKEALVQALSILSPPANVDTTQSPGETVKPVTSPDVQAQVAGPLPDKNSGINSATAVSGMPGQVATSDSIGAPAPSPAAQPAPGPAAIEAQADGLN